MSHSETTQEVEALALPVVYHFGKRCSVHGTVFDESWLEFLIDVYALFKLKSWINQFQKCQSSESSDNL
jgi:hypothetical protein